VSDYVKNEKSRALERAEEDVESAVRAVAAAEGRLKAAAIRLAETQAAEATPFCQATHRQATGPCPYRAKAQVVIEYPFDEPRIDTIPVCGTHAFKEFTTWREVHGEANVSIRPLE
jgi:hypothetical protein